MAQNIPPPPIYPKVNLPVFDLESDDEIVDVYTESGSESGFEPEPEIQPASKPQRGTKPGMRPASSIETRYECWKLTKAPSQGKDRPNWKRAERIRLSLPSDELAREAKRHRKTKSVTEGYDALSPDQRVHVEALVEKIRHDERDPNAEWELADIYRKLYDNYKIKVRETTYIRVILKRQDRKRDMIPEKQRANSAVHDSIFDISDHARVMSLEPETSRKARERWISSKEKDPKHKRKDSKRAEIVVDEGNGPVYPDMVSNSKNLPHLDQAARPARGQNQPPHHGSQFSTAGGRKFQFPSPPTSQETQGFRASTQTQTPSQQQAPSTQGSWAQRQAQPAQPAHVQPQQPGIQHPNQPGYQFPPKMTLFGMHQPGQSTVPGQIYPQQPGVQHPNQPGYQFPQPKATQFGMYQPGQSAVPGQPHAQSQQPGTQQLNQPGDSVPPLKATPFGMYRPGQSTTTGQMHQNAENTESQHQPLASFAQPLNQTTAQFQPFATVNNGGPPQHQLEPQPHPPSNNDLQPQQQATQPPQSRDFQSFSGHNISTALPKASDTNPEQPMKADTGGRTGQPTGNMFGRFSASNLQGPGRADVTMKLNADPPFAAMNSRRPDLDRGVSAGATPNYALPRMGQQNIVNDDRAKRDEILKWQSQAHLDHSRSSSSFDEQSSAIPSVDTPRTSNSGYPSDRRYAKQSAGYRFPSDHSSGYAHDLDEKVNILPARSGRRQDKPIRLSHPQQQDRPVIVQKDRRNHSASESPVRRSEKKKSQKKKSSRKDESSSESSDSDDDRYERSSKRSSRRSRKNKRRNRKEESSSESSETDSEDGRYKLSGRSRDSKSGKHSSRKSRNRSESPKRRQNRYDTHPPRKDEGSSYRYRKDSRPDSETASAFGGLSRRLLELEERQAEEAEQKKREAEKREAYERGVEDAMALKKSRPSGFGLV